MLPSDDRPGSGAPPRAGVAAVEPASNGQGRAQTPGGGNGSGDTVPAAARRLPGPSTKPALVVLGLTLCIFAIGVALELASGDQSAPSASPTSVTTARGAGMHAVPARPLMGAIVADGQPPDDLLNALAVPTGAVAVPSSAINQSVESYDRSLRFTLGASQQQVITFYRAQLPSQHWKVLSQGTPAQGSGYQILAQHPASDGNEWELGVTMAPSVFLSPSGASSGSTTTTTTAFTFRLFIESDDD